MAANPVQPSKDKAVSNSVDSFESQRLDSFSNETSTPNLQRMRSTDQSAMLAASSPAPVQAIAVKPKKGGFQITRVVTKLGDHLTDDHDCDSLDDLDETNTEDVSSDIIDLPKTVDIEQDPSSSDTIQSLVPDDLNRDMSGPKQAKLSNDPVQVTQGSLPHTAPQNLPLKPVVSNIPTTTTGQSIPQSSGQPLTHSDSNKLDKPTETHSTRFKVVKIESKEPFRRGRWTCLDFLDPPQKALPADGEKSGERVQDEDRGSGNSSAASSVHYIPGVDDPSKNPFGSSIISSEGHTIVEPQPVRPIPSSQMTNGGDFTNTQGTAASDQTITAAPSNPSSMPSAVPGAALLPASSVSTTQPLAVSQSVINSDVASRGVPSIRGTRPPTGTSVHDFSAKLQSQNIPSTSLQSMEYMKNVGLTPSLPSTSTNTSTPVDKLHSSKNISNNGSGLQLGSEFLAESGFRLRMTDKHGDGQESSALKSLSQNSLTPPLLEMVSARVRDEDDSGASTVAIDNKIEQAMDLVKSHLMFAVREEVELLKEQINELLEKNSLLEYENAILRANASPDTLSQLNAPPDSQGSAQTKQAAVSSSS